MLDIQHVTKSFTGVFEPVINNLSLSMQAGEFCVLLGANGSGKSTLMKLIAGALQPDSGSIKVNGGSSRKRLVTEVTQDMNQGTIAELSLLENMALGHMMQWRPALLFYQRYKKKVIEQLKSLSIGLDKLLDQPLGSLSGGQRQMIATLIAMEAGRPLLLLDEHTSALDPHMRNRLMTFTAQRAREKKLTTLMITHRMDDAIRYGERLLIMRAGRLVVDVCGEEKARLRREDLVRLF